MEDIGKMRINGLLIMLVIFSAQLAAEHIDDFSSDGCSHFPDGDFQDKNLWCGCCIEHDIAYWQGGDRQTKKTADQKLRQCVADITGNALLADAMYYGVTVGGSPVFPIWYRWGYGWSYGRGFRQLSTYERQQAKEKLQHYMITQANGSCDFQYPLLKAITDQFDRYFDE